MSKAENAFKSFEFAIGDDKCSTQSERTYSKLANSDFILFELQAPTLLITPPPIIAALCITKS